MAVTVFEPPSPFKGYGRSGDDAFQQASAVRALGDLPVGELLDLFRVLFALLAFVFVERHRCFLCN